MNLLLFTPEERRPDGTVAVGGRRLQHLREVHGKKPGERVRAGELGGLMGDAEIVSLSENEALLRPSLHTSPPGKLPLILVVALPRPKMLRRVLRTAAEQGVAEIRLIHSYRVEKSYWQTPALKEATVREYLLQGLQQSRDTIVPRVSCERRFKPFVEDTLPGLTRGRRALLAPPGAPPACPRGIDTPTVLVIGPEGGFIPYEVEKLQQAGCETVSLGPRILRVETAVTALVARLF